MPSFNEAKPIVTRAVPRESKGTKLGFRGWEGVLLAVGTEKRNGRHACQRGANGHDFCQLDLVANSLSQG